MSGHGQVAPLLALRWRMVRSPRVRTGLLVAGVVTLGIAVLVVSGAASAPLKLPSPSGVGGPPVLMDRSAEVATLLPTAMLAFALFAVIAPLSAGGGLELIPDAELVAYPVRVRTLVTLSFVLTPLNVAWYLQVLVLGAATAYSVRGPGGTLPPLGVLLLYLVACTAVGQAIAWGLVGVRRTRRGRVATWILLAAGLGVGAWVVTTGRTFALLDQAPTKRVLLAQLLLARGDVMGSLTTLLVMLIVIAVAYTVTVRLAAWALRRPGDRGIDGPLSRPERRRDAARSESAVLRRLDRASVWRSAPLRRGLLVLGVLPVGAALVASLPWSSITLLPPLVSSGAALLFGVNALSLDGSGAVWVSTLPHDPALVLRSKARVVTEVVGGSVLLVLLGAGLRASAAPRPLDLLCALGAAASCTALVVATSMRLSVTRPHRAELRGPRDTPAPPGTMALYSARLAVVTTLVGLVYAGASLGDGWVAPLLVTVGLVAWARLSWLRTLRLWADPARRAHVVATVAAG